MEVKLKSAVVRIAHCVAKGEKIELDKMPGYEELKAMSENMYTSGEYLEKHPTWHAEDSFGKAEEIIRMMARNNIMPKTICEVGCGAGEILKQLQGHMESQCML